MTKPKTGRTRITAVHRTLPVVDVRLSNTLRIAQMSATRTTKPKSPPRAPMNPPYRGKLHLPKLHYVAALLLVAAMAACSGPRDGGSDCASSLDASRAGVHAEVSVPRGEACSIGTYEVLITFEDGKSQKWSRERDGTLASIWLADLSADGALDLVITTTSAGSGSYGYIDLFQQAGSEFVPRALASLADDQRGGYAGHDFFEVIDGQLYRSFPVLEEEDPNCCAVGPVARFRYSFEEDRWVHLDGA